LKYAIIITYSTSGRKCTGIFKGINDTAKVEETEYRIIYYNESSEKIKNQVLEKFQQNC
jgi:hypothetical protein